MKYLISEIKYLLNGKLSNLSGEAKDIYNQIKEKGFAVVPDFISENQCAELQIELETHLKKNYTWKDQIGSDSRIYGIERVSKKFADLFENELLKVIYKKYIDKFTLHKFIMSNKVLYKENNAGSGGGWHRDVINRRQLKFICYLNDVDEENGCFQYIPHTHKISEKMKTNKLMGLKSGVYRYSNKKIEKLLEKSAYKCISLKASRGTLIIVDTSGIHRGSPMKSGKRYAVTQYMSDTPFKSHMRRLLAPNYSHLSTALEK